MGSALNKPLRILLITNSMIFFAAAMLAPIYALYVEKIGGDLLDASVAGGILAFTAGITVLLSGKYSDKIKENELIVVAGYAIVGTGFLFYTMIDSIWSLLAVQAMIGLGEAIYLPSFDALYSKHLNRNRSGAQWGMWESMRYFSTAIGAIAGGFIVTKFGFNVLFVIMAIFCYASAIYIFHLSRRVL